MNEITKGVSPQKLQRAYYVTTAISIVLTGAPCLIACERIIDNDVLAVVGAAVLSYLILILGGAAGMLGEKMDTPEGESK